MSFDPNDPKHYRFTRNTGLKRSDFEEPDAKPGDWLALIFAICILIALISGAFNGN